MRNLLDSPWLAVVVAVIGGVTFGYGIGAIVRGPTVAAAVWTGVGLVLLWWALIDRRKARRGTPESEADGSRTVE